MQLKTQLNFDTWHLVIKIIVEVFTANCRKLKLFTFICIYALILSILITI